MDTASEANALVVQHLGRLPYGEALELQQRLRQARLEHEISDTVLLLEHPDVITFGRSSKPGNAPISDDELRRAGYDVHHVNRGGDVTYHGPGQLVGYPILDLSRRGADVHVYLRQLEGVLIDTLADFGIAAGRREGYAGVWLAALHKIASIGVGLRRWTTMHGFALNVSCDLSRFDAIIPCGLRGIEMTSMRAVLGREIELAEVRERVETHLRKRFS